MKLIAGIIAILFGVIMLSLLLAMFLEGFTNRE